MLNPYPPTRRGYARVGLVVPKRARGRGRRYSLRDIAKLRHIQHLSQNEGINLEGIRRILALEDELDALRGQLAKVAEPSSRASSKRFNSDSPSSPSTNADSAADVLRLPALAPG